MTFSETINITIRHATKKEINKNYCSGHVKGKKTCKRPVKFRWSGGFFFCSVCHEKEKEEYITSSDEDSSDEESSDEDSFDEDSSDNDSSDNE